MLIAAIKIEETPGLLMCLNERDLEVLRLGKGLFLAAGDTGFSGPIEIVFSAEASQEAMVDRLRAVVMAGGGPPEVIDQMALEHGGPFEAGSGVVPV